MTYKPYEMTFEDYRYDALGRRVLVRTRRACENPDESHFCKLGTIRRTVWDGSSELYEIQMPGAEGETAAAMENDTQVLQRPVYSDFDPNPFFGRVAYTYGGGVDQPLSVTRIGYSDLSYIGQSGQVPSQTFRTVAPFAILPLWSARGQADAGVFADDGAARRCTTLNGENRCIYIDWPAGWFAYARKSFIPGSWHGTLLQDKRDGTGTLYRRNRYYDPASARFTQEDPIGLAGGLSAYGFANGDPVMYSDPYGLCAQGGSDTTKVEVCGEVADLPGNSIGLEHWWIRTSEKEAGLGQVGGIVPGDEGSDRGTPFLRLQTEIVDHRGRSAKPTVTCAPVRGANAQCVNRQLDIGRSQGAWTPVNQCQTFVTRVVEACGGTVPARPGHRGPAPGAVRREAQRQRASGASNRVY